MINTVSMANVPFLELREQLDEMVSAGVRYLHIDLMDGHYVPNLAMPIDYIEEIHKAYPDLRLDVHIMAEHPEQYIGRVAKAGAYDFCFHTDATNFTIRTLRQIREAGMVPGVVINPSQRIDSLEPFLPFTDMVLVMSVEPGFSGQQMVPGSIERLEELAALRERKGLRFQISVDGGINWEHCERCSEIGVDMVVGTRHNIFRQPEGLYAACLRFERLYGKEPQAHE